jgi:hypothetical protein
MVQIASFKTLKATGRPELEVAVTVRSDPAKACPRVETKMV